jgi:hypothetical protein
MLDDLITRDSLWTNHFGEQKKIRDLDDTHIANIIRWLPTLNRDYMVPFFLEEAKIRVLSQEFLDRAHIPYRGPDQKWYVNMKQVST